jgi:hypothetical protein
LLAGRGRRLNSWVGLRRHGGVVRRDKPTQVVLYGIDESLLWGRDPAEKSLLAYVIGARHIATGGIGSIEGYP